MRLIQIQGIRVLRCSKRDAAPTVIPEKGVLCFSKAGALYPESSFLSARQMPEAGFHLAPPLRFGLDGMTVRSVIQAQGWNVKPLW